MVHVQRLLFKKYMKNHKIIFIYIYIYIYFNKVKEKKITEEELIPLVGLKKNIGVCTTFIVSMINLTILKLNEQYLSLSLS